MRDELCPNCCIRLVRVKSWLKCPECGLKDKETNIQISESLKQERLTKRRERNNRTGGDKTHLDF